jgi:glycerol-3-phosphate O-acyltransferase
MDKPIFFVPLLVLYTKTPEKTSTSLPDIFFGYKDKPGIIRKVGLFLRYSGKAFIDFGEPLNLKAYLETRGQDRPTEELADELRQKLIESIDAQKRVILGPIMKSREQFMETTLKDPKVTKTIENIAKNTPQKVKKLRKEAEGYFDEIAADYNSAYITFFFNILTWGWKKLYEGIEVDPSQLAMVRDWARKGPVIYIPSHKSHIDYLILNYVLYEYHTHIPRIAAGKNLTFWPMGHIFRKSGAFFIRRTFKGAKLYTEVFERYVKALLEEGHPLEFFIEGGRSRSGKIVLPKIGFLSILLRAQQEGYCDDLVFVPASISYDRILEEKSLLKEFGGGDKKDENFGQMVKARHFLKRKHGKIYINFSSPFSLKEYMEQRGGYSGDIHRQLAFHVIRAINNVTMVTPLALISTAILARHRRGFYVSELSKTINTILEFLKRQNIPLASTLAQIQDTLMETLSHLIGRKIVDFIEDVDGEETFYYVDDERKPELEYYKNSIIHYFIPNAFLAISLLKGKSDVKTLDDVLADYNFLRELFENEFIFDQEKALHEEIKNPAGYFIERDLIKEADGGYKTTRRGFDELPMWAALAKTFLESYWIGASSFIQKEKGNIKRTDLLKNMSIRGHKYFKMGLIDHREAISQITFNNAIKFFNERKLKKRKQSEQPSQTALEWATHLSKKINEMAQYGL